jgi:hypothetical protein
VVQHVWPVPPQDGAHVPPVHVSPFMHMPVFATHWPFVSQHPPLVHEVPPQQALPLVPHAVHAPL